MPEPNASDTDLVGEHLACRRGGRLVFARIDLRLPAGGALILTGGNGSGKSSLLRLLATLLAPAEGRLVWAGRPVAADPHRYRAAIEYAGHLDAIKPALTPRETLSFWAALRGGVAPAIEAALDRFGLRAVADWPCRFLSAGQRRRLALARLIAVPCPVWLLDEPTAALDGDGEARLITAIAEHRAAGGRLVVATHQPLPLPDAETIRLDDYAVMPEDAPAFDW
ncbi:MAG: heme ABC exporter ATP-binding protein CcmA [Alphaproteobacteria bacterium]